MQATLDFAATEKKARRMTIEALAWSAKDASDAAEMAEGLEREGYRIMKTGGYYRDEAGIYRDELARRGGFRR